MKLKIYNPIIKVLSIILLSFISWTNTIQSQVTCSGGTTNIPRSGSVVVNGVTVSTSYTGDVADYPYSWSSCNGGVTTSANSLMVGQGDYWYPGNPSPWSVTLNFNQPVNNLVIVLTAGGSGYDRYANENFVFSSNGGSVSITAGTNCYSTISGNTIYSGSGAPLDYSGTSGGGGGIFKITSPSAYTKLTISGNGGLNGSLIAICGVSIKPACSTTAPPVNYALSYTCPATSVNLNTQSHTGTIPSGSSLVWFTNNSHTGMAYATPTAATAGTYYAFYYNSGTGCYSPASSAVTVTNTPCVCYKPGATTANGTALISKVGITSLNRSASQADNWPAVRKGGWLVLESKTKAFVPNRMAFNTSGNPVGISSANFVEGMMVYDTTNKCLKVYTSTDGGSTFGWKCMSAQTCPD